MKNNGVQGKIKGFKMLYTKGFTMLILQSTRHRDKIEMHSVFTHTDNSLAMYGKHILKLAPVKIKYLQTQIYCIYRD